MESIKVGATKPVTSALRLLLPATCRSIAWGCPPTRAGGEIQDSKFKIQNSRLETHDSRFKIQDSKFTIQDSRFKIQDSRLKRKDPFTLRQSPADNDKGKCRGHCAGGVTYGRACAPGPGAMPPGRRPLPTGALSRCRPEGTRYWCLSLPLQIAPSAQRSIPA